MVKGYAYSENIISMLAKKNPKQRKNYTPTGSTWTTAPHKIICTMKSSSKNVGKVTAGCLGIKMQVPNPPTRRDTLFSLRVGSKRKEMLTSSASKNVNRRGYISPTTSKTEITLYIPSMGRFNSTSIKRVYHTLTLKKPGRGLSKNCPVKF